MKMSHSAMQKLGLMLGMAIVAVSLGGTRAAAQAGGAAPVQVPAAPAGGIDASKMPDVIGIHLGMSPQEVIAIMKPQFPQGKQDIGVNPGYAKFGHAPNPPWIQTIIGHADKCGNNECADVVNVVFSGPPNKQSAVSIDRGLSFQQGKQPTPDTIKAALMQKYGANPLVITPVTMGWAFDEAGRPITPANGKALVQCAGNVSAAAIGGPSPTNAALEYGITGTQPLTAADVKDMLRNPCRVGVYVLANWNAAGPIVSGFTVKISENSEATRAAIAEQQYLDQVAAGQDQQQLNKAKQQAVPKL
jgi:hypothetical protein